MLSNWATVIPEHAGPPSTNVFIAFPPSREERSARHLDGFGFFVRKAVSKFGYLDGRNFWTSDLYANFRILVSSKLRRETIHEATRKDTKREALWLRVDLWIVGALLLVCTPVSDLRKAEEARERLISLSRASFPPVSLYFKR